MCFRRKDAKMAKPPKRVKVILGPGKPTGDLKKWMKKQEKVRRELLKAIDKDIAKQDVQNLEKALRKKRRNAK
jgi:hypothetical protein